MYLKKDATILISTIIILSLISVLGSYMFKMMRNNYEMGNLYKLDKDIYDLNEDEEKKLNNFMKELNESYIEEVSIEENIFSKDFKRKIDESCLEYYKDNDKIFLITYKDNEIMRSREIKYIIRNEKIVLIPTIKFKDNQVVNT